MKHQACHAKTAGNLILPLGIRHFTAWKRTSIPRPQYTNEDLAAFDLCSARFSRNFIPCSELLHADTFPIIQIANCFGCGVAIFREATSDRTQEHQSNFREHGLMLSPFSRPFQIWVRFIHEPPIPPP